MPSADKDVVKLESSHIAAGNCKMVQPPWKTVGEFIRKLNTELPYDPVIPLPVIKFKITENRYGTQIHVHTYS